MSKAQLQFENTVCTLSFSSTIDRKDCAEFKTLLEKVPTFEGIKGFVVNFSNSTNLHDLALSELVMITHQLKKREVPTFGFNQDSELEKRIKNAGLSQAIHLTNSLAEIQKFLFDQKPKANSFDTEIINPFVEGAMQTLTVQGNIECRPKKIFIKGKGPDLATEIAAILNVVSPRFNGSIALCFSKNVFLYLNQKLFFGEETEICPDNAENCGEILNIVFGKAKEILNKKNYGIQMAIPTVIYSENLYMKTLIKSPTLVIPIEIEVGVFHIEIALD